MLSKMKHNRQWVSFGLVLILFLACLAIHRFNVTVVFPAFQLSYQAGALGLPYTDFFLFLPAAWLLGGYLGAYLLTRAYRKGRKDETSFAGRAVVAAVCLAAVLGYVISFLLYQKDVGEAPRAAVAVCLGVFRNPGLGMIPGILLGTII